MQNEYWSSRRMVNVIIKSVNTERFERKVKVKVNESCPTLCNPMAYSPPGSSVHGDSPGKNSGVACHALLQGLQYSCWKNPMD